MKIIDKYLIKQFLQTIVFGLLAFTMIFVVIDAMENLDDFIDQNVPALTILHYYLVFSPEIIKLMLAATPNPPFFTITPRGAPIRMKIIHAAGIENFL